jgi:hypothetical protein
MVSFREVPYDNYVLPCAACPAALLRSSEHAPSSGMQRYVVGQVAVDVSKDCGAVSYKGLLAAENETLLSSKHR